MFFSRVKKIHMVGIGGAGMSGMAEILLSRGFHVSGCDVSEGETLDHLRSLGAEISLNHGRDHVTGHDVVVYSSAVPCDHDELSAARKARIPTIKRAEMLGEITRLGFTVAVSGTHGKTTTTSIIGYLADRLNLDPTVIVGGRLTTMPGHARIGKELYVVEADEYDRSFLSIHPSLAVMTNVDRDHLDCYDDFAEICETFLAYLKDVPFFGRVVLNLDDTVQQSFIPEINRPVITYGSHPDADFRFSDIRANQDGSEFTLHAKPLTTVFEGIAPLYGEHNVANVTAALTALYDITGDAAILTAAMAALKDFPGVARRFERVGDFEGAPVYSDYAHHPREVLAVLRGARQAYPDRHIHAIFQPHLYSRTRIFAPDFADSLRPCHTVTVLPVYGAREEPIPGVSGESIVLHLRDMNHGRAWYRHSVVEAFDHLRDSLDEPSVILVLGAGSIHHHVLRALEGETP